MKVTHIHRGQTFSQKLHLLLFEHFTAIHKIYLLCRALVDTWFQQVRRHIAKGNGNDQFLHRHNVPLNMVQ